MSTSAMPAAIHSFARFDSFGWTKTYDAPQCGQFRAEVASCARTRDMSAASARTPPAPRHACAPAQPSIRASHPTQPSPPAADQPSFFSVMTIERVTTDDLAELLPLMRGYCDFYEVSPGDDELLDMSRELIADPEKEGVQFIARD